MMPPRIAYSKGSQRNLEHGDGFITERGGKFQSRWREDKTWKAKTFLTRLEAENWLRFRLWRKDFVPHQQQKWATFNFSVNYSIVYFVQPIDGGLIKIGYARHLRHRFQAIQNSCPIPLRILAIVRGGFSEEQELHRQFADLRVHAEWFAPGDELLTWIYENTTTYHHLE